MNANTYRDQFNVERPFYNRSQGSRFSANGIQPGTVFVVNGIINYSRISRLISGRELDEVNAKKKARNPHCFTRSNPYSTITLSNVSIPYINYNGTDSNTRLPHERWLEDHLHASGTHPEGNPYLTHETPGKLKSEPNTNQLIQTGLPDVYEPIYDANGNQEIDAQGKYRYKQVDMQGRELAPGLHVTLIMQCYKSNNSANHGIAVKRVMVQEPVRFYQKGNLTAAMQDSGITNFAFVENKNSTPNYYYPEENSASGTDQQNTAANPNYPQQTGQPNQMANQDPNAVCQNPAVPQQSVDPAMSQYVNAAYYNMQPQAPMPNQPAAQGQPGNVAVNPALQGNTAFNQNQVPNGYQNQPAYPPANDYDSEDAFASYGDNYNTGGINQV